MGGGEPKFHGGIKSQFKARIWIMSQHNDIFQPVKIHRLVHFFINVHSGGGGGVKMQSGNSVASSHFIFRMKHINIISYINIECFVTMKYIIAWMKLYVCFVINK